MAKVTDIALIGGLAALAYVLWSSSKDAYNALGEIGQGISGALSGVQQAPSVISQYLNPLDYGGDLVTALSEYWKVSAEYQAKVAQVQQEITERRTQEAEVQQAAAEYKRDPTVETRTALIQEVKESYQKQLAHVKPGWQTITVGGEAYETAEEWLGQTLQSKGYTKEEINFITGLSPSLPDPLTPTPELAVATDTSSGSHDKQTNEILASSRSKRQEEGTWTQSREDADVAFYKKQLDSGVFTQKQYEFNVRYFAGR